MSVRYRFLDFVGLPADPFITSASTALFAVAVAEYLAVVSVHDTMILATLQHPERAAGSREDRRRQRLADLPLHHLRYIRPALIVSGLFRLIDSFKAFPLIYVLTGRRAGQRHGSHRLFRLVQAFDFSYWGYASAIAIVLLTVSSR